MINTIELLKNWVLDLLFPCFCSGCNKEGFYLCEDCEKNKLKFLSAKNRPLCAFSYNDSLIRTMIYSFKYSALKSMDQTLAKLIGNFLAQNKICFSKEWIISFVPMHPEKQNLRGFNQAELLAKQLAGILNLKFQESLEKVRQTLPQMQLNRNARLTNLEHAFKALPCVAGAKIILIDDVCTTGATFSECKKTLLDSGARRVLCLALAKD